ncbi:MAG: PaaI family thioesterase [Chromatiales bacterium]|nr:PaaI family thioesterase [Gammaproteobacteria bacterium]
MHLTDWLRYTGWISPARRLEWFPPFRSMGVKVLALENGWRKVRLLLPLNRRTRNPGGSMFGGSIAALADPISALSCNRVFPGHAVWTRHLEVDFRRPGLFDLELRFDFDADIEQQIAADLAHGPRSDPSFEFGFYLPNGEVCAWVTNRVAIRPMDRSRSRGGALRQRQPRNRIREKNV